MHTQIPTGGYKLNFLANNTAGHTDAEVRMLMILMDRWSEGGWFPSLTKIAEQTGWDVRKVRRVRDGLVAKGTISYEPGDGRTNSDYELKTAKAWWETRGDTTTAPRMPHPPPEGAIIRPPISLPESSQLSLEQDRAQKAARIRQLLRTVPDELLPTVKALQQIPAKPGCDYAKLIPAVLETAQRCGPSAIDDLYRLVAGEKGKLPSWQLYRMLEGLKPHSDQQQTDPSPQPVEATAFEEAKHVVEQAHPSVKAQIAVQNRIRLAGGRVEAGWWADRRHWIAQELARVIAGERGTDGKL